MLILISPAKTLDMETQVDSQISTLPDFLEQSDIIASVLKKKKPAQLSKLMGISPKLGQLNFERYQDWTTPYIEGKSKQAVFAFRGDVFTGLDIDTFTEAKLEYTQKHLRILSGLYGILRPMDLIMAYRLEMGTKLSVKRKKDLYAFWGNTITSNINELLEEQNDNVIINLASNEYFKSINAKKLNAEVFTPVFKDFKNGEYKVISFFAKKARGLMSRFILQNRLSNPSDLKHFEEDGYYYNDKLSNNNVFTFTRG